MSSFLPINREIAIQLWNSFASSLLHPPPLSFNPSLSSFYYSHFGWSSYYVLLYNKDELVGLLPLVNSGKAWVSLPRFSYGGVLAKDNCSRLNDANIINDVIAEANKYDVASGFFIYKLGALSKKVSVVPNKFFIRTLRDNNDSKYAKSEKITSIVSLPPTANEFSKQLSSNLSRKIRKAAKSGITVSIGTHELLNDFYKVYKRNIYELKSMAYELDFFKDLLDAWDYGIIAIFVAFADGVPTGAGMLASYNGFYENMYFATLKNSRKLYVSDFLHWQMIKYCIDNERNNKKTPTEATPVYSFGRSTLKSTVHMYKSHWPITDFPIYINSNLPNIRKQKWLQTLWGTIPYAIASRIGSRLIKHIY